uniref:Retinoic acid receptor responder protein 1 n=1 Tax=Camelus bactrianus TaxID=9837 RepID=A0A9W3HFV9_CAMBA|nr:retinoic acid receptor responder protein 1 [Camelus bactrianus]
MTAVAHVTPRLLLLLALLRLPIRRRSAGKVRASPPRPEARLLLRASYNLSSHLPGITIHDLRVCVSPHSLPGTLPLTAPHVEKALPSPLSSGTQINQKKERKVDLVFTTELYNPEEGNKRLGKCSARVFFRNEKPRPAVNVTCAQLIEKKKRHEKDYQLYKRMKQLQNPVDVVSIPDNHGHIDPSLKPIWDLAFLGSSYVMWEKTTQFLHYYMAQLSRVKQWKTNDDAIDFGYTVLLHEFSTQEIIPCHIHLVWYPGKPLKVKDHCQEPHTPEEASGTEEGSAVAPTELSNF